MAKALLEFLRGPDYEAVQRAFIFLESHGAALQISTLSNLRDVLDHVIRAVQPGVTAQDRAAHLAEASEHLRRASVNPLQDYVEGQLQSLDRVAKWYFVRRELFTDVPTEKEFLRRNRQILDTLAEARPLKGNPGGHATPSSSTSRRSQSSRNFKSRLKHRSEAWS